jgi:cytidyltransferase-like protein
MGLERRTMKTVAISGYFDPLHVGHLEYMKLAAKLGDRLIVIVNNDIQCKLKKGKSFMPEADRMKIVESMSVVDRVFLSIDKTKDVSRSLAVLKPNIFANGGDRHTGEVPESAVCEQNSIQMMDGLGEKIRSSSELTGIKQFK